MSLEIVSLSSADATTTISIQELWGNQQLVYSVNDAVCCSNVCLDDVCLIDFYACKETIIEQINEI